MRDIIFRGKEVLGKWVYGNLITVNNKELRKVYGYNRPGIITADGLWDVNPNSVGQFIGLCDKNGKRIFEGDVVRYCDDIVADVVWDEGDILLKEDFEGEYHYHDYIIWEECEVVGYRERGELVQEDADI